MPTRNVVLTDRQEHLVQSLVESGRYQNVSEVIREGLRLIEQREAEDSVKLEVLRAAADAGLAALDAGAYSEFSGPESLQQYLEALAERVAKSPNPRG